MKKTARKAGNTVQDIFQKLFGLRLGIEGSQRRPLRGHDTSCVILGGAGCRRNGDSCAAASGAEGSTPQHGRA